jgi:hypothetical protein
MSPRLSGQEAADDPRNLGYFSPPRISLRTPNDRSDSDWSTVRGNSLMTTRRTPHDHDGHAASVPQMGAWDTAGLADLRDWVEGLRTAAHRARGEGNIALADALDQTRHEVYASYVDEDYTSNKAKRLNRDAATR